MTTPPAPDPLPPPEIIPDEATFLRRLAVATLSLLLLVLVIHLLEKFRTIFQPLFIGLFIVYLILPIHTWLVRRGLRPAVAYAAVLCLIVLSLTGIGVLVGSNYEQFRRDLPSYERDLEQMVKDVLLRLSVEVPEGRLLRQLTDFQLVSSQQLLGYLGAAVGTFVDFSTLMFVTLIYLIFLVIERETFPNRIVLAFGETHGNRIQGVIQSANVAIAQYISVKTLVSLLAAIASLVVMLSFGLDFAITWALFIFLFNFVPYLGSLVATALPILLAFVQLGAWQGIVLGILLVAIQQAIGVFVEPRFAGRRLGISPLLILLSLAFWGVIWGVVGMILAVPILVVIRIVLENIKETRPIAILLSNQ